LDNLLPKKRAQTRDIEGALDWLRSKAPGAAGDDSIPSFYKIGSVPMSRRSPKQRAQDLKDALNWTRNKGDANDPTGDFRKWEATRCTTEFYLEAIAKGRQGNQWSY
jgi:hypothetical protein